MLPNDPILLYGVVNTKLRDEYPTLEELCKSEEIDRADLLSRLADAGFEYIPDINQFR